MQVRLNLKRKILGFNLSHFEHWHLIYFRIVKELFLSLISDHYYYTAHDHEIFLTPATGISSEIPLLCTKKFQLFSWISFSCRKSSLWGWAESSRCKSGRVDKLVSETKHFLSQEKVFFSTKCWAITLSSLTFITLSKFSVPLPS